jgi:c-di-GMP-binding flagellar brake protein YcgR
MPSSTDTAPESARSKVEVLSNEQISEYLLHDPREIRSVLQSIVKQNNLVSIYFDHGNGFLLTTLIEVGENGIFLDRGSDVTMNREILKAAKVFCVTHQSHVKLQFILHGVESATYEGQPAFSAAVPKDLLRLQRREYYRLRTPLIHPPICRIPFKRKDTPVAMHDYSVLDISIGGIQLQIVDVPLETEQVFKDCVLEMPGNEPVKISLLVRSVNDVVLRSGKISQRAGCKFVDLEGAVERAIQRYITRTERDRNAIAKGMG